MRRKTTVIYNAIILAIAILLASLPLVEVPISVSARGTIRASQEDVPLVSLVGGRVVQSGLQTTNQLVKEGDTLLVLTAEGLENRITHQSRLRNDYDDQLHDLRQLVTVTTPKLKTGIYQEEWAALQQKVAELKTKVDLAQRELDRNTILQERAVISVAEHEKTVFRFAELKDQINSLRTQQFAMWQVKKQELEQKKIALLSDLQAGVLEKENLVVKAPSAGRVTNMKGIYPGNYVVQGQHLGDISPEESLIAECMVPPSAIGFIKVGQLVKLQVDAYNYNQWGLASGLVVDIDNNVVLNQQTGEVFFRVRCVLDDNTLSLKNGYQATIGKGSTYTARFYLLDRTLWQLLFDRLDDWFNPALQEKGE
ncbi:HlyD family secretion protein [Sphingobacterium psychroaquaticum]|uniref:HlyD family secretion protein n=1 Tax=Sphingobacterium psychroaquaticum TaxID=561061 RepID=A0A1X7KXY6_9SPHI|nr:HlyD family efflux transporter periplasmic adaptor subunit [Sphingobacterium psychroaquaticum]SMG46325.1 HlyD family secretion protein [Sphingobacterium psychroaquaticum]